MEHDHIKFYSNSMRGREGNQLFYPQLDATDNIANIGSSNANIGTKSTSEKHADIVEYLKTLNRDMRATFVDIKRVLNVDLEVEFAVLDMIKNNTKIDMEESADRVLSFQYRAKYEIRNKADLLRIIDRVKSGVLMSDVMDCYPGLEGEVREMIVAGTIIAVKNGEKKTIVMYPRGKPYFSNLPGTVTAQPGNQMVSTSEPVSHTIRRGDAVCIGESWYRVSPATDQAHVAERAKAPLSVTSDKEMSKRNVYSEEFTDKVFPLDGDYDGSVPFVGKAYRHGCSNDIRLLWANTAALIRPFIGRERELTQELLRHKLISRVGLEDFRPVTSSRIVKTTKAPRKKRASTAASNSQNSHLLGTELEFLMA